MGYYSRFSGEITFDPPLSWEEYAALPEQVRSQDLADGRWVAFLGRPPQDRNAVAGMPDIRPYDRILCNSEEMKAYNFKERVEEIALAVSRPGRTFSGAFNVEGENSGDIWRLKPINGGPRMRKVVARIVWEDDDEEKV